MGKGQSLKKNELGNKYGKLSVFEFDRVDKSGLALWKCRCDCGNIISMAGKYLRNGNTKSCGCLRAETGKRTVYIAHKYRYVKHGMARKEKGGVSKEYRMWCLAKKRAKNKNIDFRLEPTDIRIPDICPLLNIPLVFNKRHVGFNSPCLDRIDISKGYVLSNVWVISDLANRIKTDATLSQIKMLAENLEQALLEKQINAR